MTTITISLEPNIAGQLIYYPGTILKGTVTLTLEKGRKFRGCYITVFGCSKTSWTGTKTISAGQKSRSDSFKVKYEGQEIYINSKTCIFGQNDGSLFEIQSGIHKYNFSCQLPHQLPYSMDFAHGNISYHVEAVLDIPWRFDKDIKTPFTVVRYDDLNLYPELKIPQEYKEVKTFCCLFCESELLFMNVKIPCTGFSVGHKIPIAINYENKSNVDVTRTKVKLRRLIAYSSQLPENKVKAEKITLFEIDADGVKGGESTNFVVDIDIPINTITSNGRFCKTVIISYMIRVSAEVDGCNTNPQIAFPIVIGSVPIRQYDYPILHQQTSVDDDLPPTFEEAMRMTA